MKKGPGHSLILGLDPGGNHTGYGLIDAGNQTLDLVAQGRFSPKADWPLERRLKYIYQGLYELASSHRPQAAAVEDIFYGPNVRSALRLGHARGVALLVAALVEAPVFEYPPNLVKSAVAGYGKASKDQVAHMVRELLNFREPLAVDASDALAVAICHAGQCRLGTLLPGSKSKTGPASSWRKISPEDLAALGYKE